MASDDHSGARPAGPVVLRIKLRYDDIETMVQRFAPNVGKSGLFLPTKSIQPIGTEVKFELRLSNDSPVLVGLGRVKQVKPHDPAHPKAAFGMAIELMRVSREGREVIIKMLERRRAMGLPEVAIPVPEDVDASRRADVETQPRGDTSGIVREAMRDFASAPVAEQVLSAPAPKPVEAAPVEAPKAPEAHEAVPVLARASAPLMTAPRQGSGPIPTLLSDASSGRRSVPVLAPETARAKRPRAADLLAKANDLADRLGTVSVPGLDDQVDLSRALARARALAGSDLESELAALRESVSAPVEISIEAASAELARQLGGKPIAKRDRSAKWAAPVGLVQVRSEPAPMPPMGGVTLPSKSADGDGFIVKTRAATEASPAAMIAAVTAPAAEPVIEPVPELEAAPVVEPVAEQVSDAAAFPDEKTPIPQGDEFAAAYAAAIDPSDSLEIPTELPRSFSSIPDDQLQTTPGVDERTAMLIDDAADPERLRRAIEGSSPALALDEHDLEPVEDDDLRGESTHIGSFPIDPQAFFNHGQPTVPDDLADQLDRQLAEAEVEADEDFRQMQQPYTIQPYENERHEGYDEPAQPVEQVSDLDVLAEADAGDADLMNAHGERELSGAHHQAYADPEPAYGEQPQYGESQYAEQQHSEEQQAYAEQPQAYPAPVHEAVTRPSQDDFAARLDLDDEPSEANRRRLESLPEPIEGLAFDEEEDPRSFPTANPRPSSRAHARAQSDFHDPPSASYTFAEPFPQQGGPQFAPHEQGEDFDEPHGFTQNTPVPATRAKAPSRAPQPTHETPRAKAPSRAPEPHYAPEPEPPSDDLEDALSALDVDLDPVQIQQRRARRKSGGQRPLPGLPVHRDPTGGTPVVPAARPRTAPSPTVRPTGERREGKTMPPPIPAAARRSPATTPPPLPVRPPPKRAATDDGILIDFDEDE